MTNPDGAPAWWNSRTFGPEQGVKDPEPTPVEASMRVRSDDYGDGTVVAVLATGVQIMWDKPWLPGTRGPQKLLHDPAFAAGLERLP